MPAPIPIAVFDFELEDMSAAGSANGVAAADAAYLADVTEGVRELLARSGRFHVIDAAGDHADRKHTLRDCGGCDASLAKELGADQSLVGVVRRVSRTEYTVRFQLRDVRTGALVSQGDSGLRMGADYSWTRGAVRLVRDRLLESQPLQ
jgi:Tol biopolymer transport system component